MAQGDILTQGKTKRIVDAGDSRVFIETLDDLTGGDAAKVATIDGIAAHKTTQAVNVFNLLRSVGIPCAYLNQPNPITMLCSNCDMLPLELVIRRFAWGSYLKRESGIVSTPEKPHRFTDLVLELFHKHSVVIPPLVDDPMQIDEAKARELYLRDDGAGKKAWVGGVYTDPLIIPGTTGWGLYSAKVPVSGSPLMTIDPVLSSLGKVYDLMRRVFLALEHAWAGIETRDGAVSLVDMKLEVGFRKSDGALVLADVIDNDSWRIWPGGDPRKQLDKQCFRDDSPLSYVAENYELVARLTDQFTK